MGGRWRSALTGRRRRSCCSSWLWELAKLVLPADGVSIGDTRVLPRTDDAADAARVDRARRSSATRRWPAPRRPARSALAVASGALFTLGLALGGLVLGGVLGVVLALVMQRFRLVERAHAALRRRSQTVPLIAIAPLVAGWGGKIAILGWAWQPWASVMVISAYLAFFPIAVGMLRGLTSPAPADVELFRDAGRGLVDDAAAAAAAGLGAAPDPGACGWPRRPRWSARSSPRSPPAPGAASAG